MLASGQPSCLYIAGGFPGPCGKLGLCGGKRAYQCNKHKCISMYRCIYTCTPQLPVNLKCKNGK